MSLSQKLKQLLLLKSMRKMRNKIYDKRGNWIELSNDDDEFENFLKSTTWNRNLKHFIWIIILRNI